MAKHEPRESEDLTLVRTEPEPYSVEERCCRAAASLKALAILFDVADVGRLQGVLGGTDGAKLIEGLVTLLEDTAEDVAAAGQAA